MNYSNIDCLYTSQVSFTILLKPIHHDTSFFHSNLIVLNEKDICYLTQNIKLQNPKSLINRINLIHMNINYTRCL